MKKKVVCALGAFVLAAGVFFGGQNNTKAEAVSEDTKIADGIYIGTIYVGGMTEQEANDAITKYVDNLMSTTFVLKGVQDKSVKATAKEMGITADASDSVKRALAVTHCGNLISRYKDSIDLKSEKRELPLALEVDKQQTAKFIYQKHDKLSVDAVNATLKRKNGQFEYVAGKDGEEVVVVDSVYAINQFLATEYDGEKTEIALVTKVLPAKGTQEELSKIKDRLGTYTTKYGNRSGSNREKNVENGCSFINGKVVYPNEEFFTHKTLEPITEENGYAMGGTYINGQTVDSVGGGICQVSTTLYNALIRAEVKISMRCNHSMTVTYVDPSADAAMAGDYKDLRFINNTGYPIYIEGYCDGVNITFNIYGVETRAAGRKVDFESVIVTQEEPTLQIKTDASQPVGYYNVDQYPHTGMKAQLWKVVTQDGKEVSRDLFNSSTYRSSPKIVTVGTKGATAEQQALINNGVASKNEDQLWAAVEQAKALSAPQQPAQTPANDATGAATAPVATN